MQLGERGIHCDLHHLAASRPATAPLCPHDRSLWLQPTLTSRSAPMGSTEVREARTRRKSGKELVQLGTRAGRGARGSKSAKSPSKLAHHRGHGAPQQHPRRPLARRAQFLRCLPVAAGIEDRCQRGLCIRRESGEGVPQPSSHGVRESLSVALQASQRSLRVAQAAPHYGRCNVRPPALEPDSEVASPFGKPWSRARPQPS